MGQLIKDISALVAAGQSETLHWFPEEALVTRLAVVLAGMANTRGGTVLIGVAPNTGEISGVRSPDEAIDRVFQAALLTDPPLVLPIPAAVTVGSACVLWVSVPPGLPHVYSLEGRYFGRQGSQNLPLSARKLRQLLLERGVVQFEAQTPPEASLDDLDMERVAAYVAALGLSGSDPLEILYRRGCLKLESAQDRPASRSETPARFRPTYAALLLFGRYPQQWVPSATILAARFTGATFSDRFVKQDFSGPLPEQLRQAEAFLRANLRRVVRLVGLTHEETLEYPFEAVRELLVNAVAHRDYNQQGDTIHLHIFADRLEVHSPGGLPGPVTLENLLEARFSRNAVLVQALSDLGFVERLGYGLDRVVTAMRLNGLRPPQFEEIASAFRVTLFGPIEIQPPPPPDLSAYRQHNLNPRQLAALAYLLQHKRISNSDYQALRSDVHPETLRRDLSELVSLGLLIKVGDKRATYYILK